MAGDTKDDDNEDRGTSSSDKRWWQEAVKEISLTGLAAIFMTEDSVRSYLRDKKLPKELVGLLLDGVSKKKDDFYGLLAKEVGRVFGKIDMSREIEKFLEKHNVQIEAKISFEKKSGVAVKVRHHSKEDKGTEDA